MSPTQSSGFIATALGNWGQAWANLFKRTGNQEMLEVAIILLEEAISRDTPGSNNRVQNISNLGVLFCSRFLITGDGECLDHAIQLAGESTKARMGVYNLASFLAKRSEWRGNTSDLDYAAALLHQELERKPRGHFGYNELSQSLSNVLLQKFTRTRDLSDINQAVYFGNEAIETSPVGQTKNIRFYNQSQVLFTSCGRPDEGGYGGPHFTSTGIIALELPKLRYADISESMDRLSHTSYKSRGLNLKAYAEGNKEMKKILLWLWDSAVEPVLERLCLNGSESTNLSHIWWIGVGALSKAPFHAAGDHSRGSTRNTISRVISSYIPTIRALFYARQKGISLFDPPHLLSDDRNRKQSPSSESGPGILLVTMLSSAGQASLSGVIAEVNGILKTLPTEQFRSKVLERPSSLQLAYLSACSTAENSSWKLANEVLHIASGFQLAGFSHVLATLWESQDAICCDVATEFYRLLFNGEGEATGHQRVAWAYHQAVKKARDKKPLSPLGWVPLIHTGA
ncbi:hypothetical protein K440DRAFT_659708 [Wilcoxina mikolae CBS 423.85]|nr:hypothetical protein K440DRAFT_659708 [Wilcoxina mikolae CBS 423.85]